MLRILTYHRIADPLADGELNPRSISATPEQFTRQMEILARHYRVLSPSDALATLADAGRLAGKSVLVTFDDGYRDFAQNAWPVMKSLGLPVTLFVPTSYPDAPRNVFWWDRLHRMITRTKRSQITGTPLGDLSLESVQERHLAVRRLQDFLKLQSDASVQREIDRLSTACEVPPENDNGILSWNELRCLAEEGVVLGAHTRNHKTLAEESLEGIREEVAGSLADLEREMGRVEPIFCYPGGSHDDRVVEITRRAGVKLAFTTLDGPNPLTPDNLLRLRRTNITPRTSEWIFRLRLLPVGTHIDRWRHRRKRRRSTP